MATAHCLDFHQFNETYLHELRAQDVTTEAHFVDYFSKILHNKLRRRLACPEHIKDVQQETLLRAWAAVRAEGGIVDIRKSGEFDLRAGDGLTRQLCAAVTHADDTDAQSIVCAENLSSGETTGETRGHVADEVSSGLHGFDSV